jgi:Txe/YoeB family toxin of toxin-antitoxin system
MLKRIWIGARSLEKADNVKRLWFIKSAFLLTLSHICLKKYQSVTSVNPLYFQYRATAIDPRNGIGKPERLKYFDKEVYSRRVNHKDRMIYTIYENESFIDISSFKGHY